MVHWWAQVYKSRFIMCGAKNCGVQTLVATPTFRCVQKWSLPMTMTWWDRFISPRYFSVQTILSLMNPNVLWMTQRSRFNILYHDLDQLNWHANLLQISPTSWILPTLPYYWKNLVVVVTWRKAKRVPLNKSHLVSTHTKSYQVLWLGQLIVKAWSLTFWIWR